jgi:hypothetical protein
VELPIVEVSNEMQQLVEEKLRYDEVDFLSLIDFPLLFG